MKKPPIMVNSVSWHARRDAVVIDPSDCRAMISVSEPGSPAPLKEGWKKILRLEFHDIQEVTDDDELRYTIFTTEMASKTIDFIDSIQDSVSHIYVHCYLGVSRSAAIARFIADRYGLPFNREYNLYNKFVNRLLATEDARRMFVARKNDEQI